MKIQPLFHGRVPVGARLTIDTTDAARLAELLSYARDVEGPAGVLAERLSGLCEALDGDADTGRDGTSPMYVRARRQFEPTYKRGSIP